MSMGFPRQEYWSRLPFPSLGDLPDPGTEPGSPALQEKPPGKPRSSQNGTVIEWLRRGGEMFQEGVFMCGVLLVKVMPTSIVNKCIMAQTC